MEIETCLTCRYFRKMANVNTGRCHYHPPRFLNHVFPIIDARDFCSEHKPVTPN